MALLIFNPERLALRTGSGKVSEVTGWINALLSPNVFATVSAIS